MYIILTKNAELINKAKEKGEQMINLNGLTFDDINISDSKANYIDKQEIPQKSKNLRTNIIHLIMQLGVPAHIKGYNYLIFALNSLITDSEFDANGVTKSIYPNIAIHFKTTPSKVDKNLRHAIKLACERGNANLFEKIFGYSIDANKETPSNSEFLYGLKFYLERSLYEG